MWRLDTHMARVPVWYAWRVRSIIEISERYWPLIVIVAGLVGIWATVVAVLCAHGRRLDRHQEWSRRLELSLGNLHRDRRARECRVLQTGTPRPPTLSAAETVEVTPDMLSTLRLDPKNDKDGPT